jgi:hypothetical protein
MLIQIKVSTLTQPPFYISPLPPRRDPLRCSIITEGLYYDTVLTAVLQLALANRSKALVLDVGANIGSGQWFLVPIMAYRFRLKHACS